MKIYFWLLLPAFFLFMVAPALAQQPLMAFRLDPYLFDGGLYSRLAVKKGVEPTLKTLQDKTAADPPRILPPKATSAVFFSYRPVTMMPSRHILGP